MNIQAHPLTQTDAKLFETLADSDPVMINHVVIPAGEGFAAHPTDSNVFIHVLRGKITLTFENGTSVCHPEGQLIEIPYLTLMKIDNLEAVPLELVVVKAPNPKMFIQPQRPFSE